MATAMLDQTAAEQSAAYVMPTVLLGTPIMFYAYGETAGGGGGTAGRVIRAHNSGRAISIVTWDGKRHDAVRHVSDPKLQSHTLEENGSWDVTPSEKKTVRELFELNRKVEVLTQQVEALMLQRESVVEPRARRSKGKITAPETKPTE